MRILAWSLIWIFLSITVTGIVSYALDGMDLTAWRTELRTAGGVFFMAALVIGGVLTTKSAYRSRKRFFYREDWSFICILVTISLFGLSLLIR
ncbi:MAG: hypothetical protein WBZ33_16175 [Thermoactinomyces sp.]|jgi:cbb3-type cytochrome oxidase subunit 1